MPASRRKCLYASLALLAFLLLAPRTHGETLTITSSPPGATLEIDGQVVGTTPYEISYPSSYFHKPHTVFSARLGHAMVAHIYKNGYAGQRLTLTSGPLEWVAITGRHHGKYFVLKSEHFDIKLEPASERGVGSMETNGREGPIHPHPAASTLPGSSEATAESATVQIESDPPQADIFIDWKFAGQTPSTIHLASGPHHIELRLRGRQNWERELELARDSKVTLHPALELQP
ncbi:MAG: PEGA domain-containing protein [Candidatus Acidiferrales bacterium]